MKKFLVLTDFTYSAKIAFDYTLRLAEKAEAKIDLLHVKDISLFNSFIHTTPGTSSDYHENSELDHRLNNWKKEGNQFFKSSESDCVVDYILLEGKPLEKIIEHIQNHDYQLVISNVKHGGKIRQLMGSLNYPILDETKTPILFIPEIENLKLPEEIVFTSDFNEKDSDFMKQIYRLFSLMDINICLTHYSEDDDLTTDNKLLDVFIDSVQQQFPYQRMTKKILTKGDEESLYECLHSIENGWISMSTYTRSFFDKLINPSISKQLMQSLNRPMLLFKQADFN